MDLSIRLRCSIDVKEHIVLVDTPGEHGGLFPVERVRRRHLPLELLREALLIREGSTPR
jgi:hypothetical protein